MRDFFSTKRMTQFSVSFLLAVVVAMVSGCSDNTGASTPTSTTPAAGIIALGTSANSILTDNATSATLTATLVDSSNAVMPGVDISFLTSTGNLSGSTAKTDKNGQASVTLKSGLSDYSNRTAIVTASVGAQSASIPVLIKGSTLTLTLPSSTIQVGAGTITATATAAVAGGLGTPNQTIRFAIGAASTGTGTLSATTLTTDATGVTPAVKFTPTVAGTVDLTAEWLNSAGAVTVTTTQVINVTAPTGVAFAITTPVANPLALTTAATQEIVVTVPSTIASTAVANVRMSATSGSLAGTNPLVSNSSILQTPAANAVTATYTASVNSGSVTIQVDALSSTGVTLSSLSRTFAISAPATAAAQVTLSASVSAISPSTGTSISTSTLKAVVRDSKFNTVGNAAVIFGLLGTTGSGETVSPAVVYTDAQGVATTTFSAGTSSTLSAIHAQASIVGQFCTGAPQASPPVAETNKLCDTTPLRVSSSAVSVTVGFGTAIEDTANTTQYKLPGSVLVVDSNGSAAAGIPVTLSVFPAKYRNGYIYRVRNSNATFLDYMCGGPYNVGTVVTSDEGKLFMTGFAANEDANRNGFLDDGTFAPAEDTPTVQTASQIAAMAISNNVRISPPQASGGSVPITVTTDSFGAATFYLQYPKASAWFIEDEVTARVIVSGTESTAKVNQILPMSLVDANDDNCIIGRAASY
ncbi:MAG: hypothetical protein HOO95_02540 [Gallionella sp.]|nr:hypothetical protein [Gallionella sp.]